MRAKTQSRNELEVREEREQQLKDFIRDGVRAVGAGKAQIIVLARAPESMVTRVLFELSDELASACVPARIVFAGGAVVTSGETWQLSFNSGFAHEIRIVREPRLLDGHEQLVIGDSHVWYGDSMRREPDKRDAYSCFRSADLVAGSRARTTFGRIWAQAAPVYVHSGIVAAIAKAETAAVEPVAVMPAAPDEVSAVASMVEPATLPPAAAETLDAWQPSTRH